MGLFSESYQNTVSYWRLSLNVPLGGPTLLRLTVCWFFFSPQVTPVYSTTIYRKRFGEWMNWHLTFWCRLALSISLLLSTSIWTPPVQEFILCTLELCSRSWSIRSGGNLIHFKTKNLVQRKILIADRFSQVKRDLRRFLVHPPAQSSAHYEFCLVCWGVWPATSWKPLTTKISHPLWLTCSTAKSPS